MTYVDAHTHLDHHQADIEQIVAEAADAGVDTLIHSGTYASTSWNAVALADHFPGVYASVGFHPHNAQHVDDAGMAFMEQLTAHPKVVAVGESGLDFFRNYSPQADQERVFVEHMDLARRTGLPLVVHTRQAQERTFDLLQEHADGITVVLHCFSVPERLEEVVERGYYASFAGNITYGKSDRYSETLKAIPNHLILVETDAPYLTPVPYRGQVNTPARVVLTYEFIARERGTTPEALAAIVRENVRRAYPRIRLP